jgi:hypothetical protein
MAIEYRTEGKVEFLRNANRNKKPPNKDERNVELVSIPIPINESGGIQGVCSQDP